MEISFRPAHRDDIPALRRVLGDEPSDVEMGLAGGDPARAREFRALVMGGVASPAGVERTTVAVVDGEVAGLLQIGAEDAADVTPALAWRIVRIFGIVGALKFLRRDRVRSKVQIPAPAGTYHIAELHVAPSHRNKGIGAALLGEAERLARAAGEHTMSLTTTTVNPARHLYERHGFQVVQIREDAGFKAITGVSGRLLMTKELN